MLIVSIPSDTHPYRPMFTNKMMIFQVPSPETHFRNKVMTIAQRSSHPIINIEYLSICPVYYTYRKQDQ